MRAKLVELIRQHAKEQGGKLIIPKPEKLFPELAQSGFVWEQILKTLVLVTDDEILQQAKEAAKHSPKKDAQKDQQPKGEDSVIIQQLRAENKLLMDALIEARDVFDCLLYKTAVDKEFPNIGEHTITTEADSYVKEVKEGRYIETLKFYRIRVFPRSAKGYTDYTKGEPCIEIEVKAPGSRRVTSDIDTTISVSGAERVLESPDTSDTVKWKVIQGFNQESEKRCGITSAMSRDSNVYSDGFLEKPEYSKFNTYVNRCRAIGDDVLPKNFYLPYKKQKQHNELAASCIHLCSSLTNEEWEAFKGMVQEELNELADQDNFNQAHIARVTVDLNKVYDRTKKDFVDHQSEQMTDEDEGEEEEEEDKESTKEEEQKRIVRKNAEIQHMNQLYIEHLKVVDKTKREIALLHPQIIAVLGTGDGISPLQNLRETRIKEEKGLAELQKGSAGVQKYIHRQEKVVTRLQDEEKAMLANLGNLLTQHATLLNRQQEEQIKANLFAYEAYLNRSAPYHVVEGMQKRGEVSLSRQVVMGSALEQIGFKLCHMQEMAEEGARPEEIAYKTAKYGQRVADVVFGACFEPVKGASKRLPALEGGTYEFDRKERAFLNEEIKIAVKVKGNKEILDHQKYAATSKYMKYYNDSKEILLRLGAKILAASYHARMTDEKKKALWGELTAEELRVPEAQAPTSQADEVTNSVPQTQDAPLSSQTSILEDLPGIVQNPQDVTLVGNAKNSTFYGRSGLKEQRVMRIDSMEGSRVVHGGGGDDSSQGKHLKK